MTGAVSIHARFISRAILQRVRVKALFRCFNPRPVYKPGDTKSLRGLGLCQQVSIHARFISRAIHQSSALSVGSTTFQSTPGL